MLTKLKQIPIKVLLSAAFLLALLVTITVLHTPFGLMVVVVIAAIYSMINVLEYWNNQQ